MEEDSSVCSNESGTLLKHASLLSGELTIKERLVMCCKPSFRLRRLKNKGAILILVWSYCCVSVPFFYLRIMENTTKFSINTVAFGFTLSVAGWIADVRFGRYKVMYFSMWIMWAALMLATVSSVLTKILDRYDDGMRSYVDGVL